MAKTLDIRDSINFPRDLVFKVYSEQLDELPPYLPNIDSIKVEKRVHHEDGRIELVNLWKASRSEVPALIRPFVKPEMLQWYDYAEWDPSDYVCRWRSEFLWLNGAITSSGINYYRAIDENSMEVHLTGSIEADATKIPGVPRFLSNKVASNIENGAVRMAELNLRAMNQGFAMYVTGQQGIAVGQKAAAV